MSDHTQGAIRAAEAITARNITDEQYRIATAYGDKSVEGIAAMIDKLTSPDIVREERGWQVHYFRLHPSRFIRNTLLFPYHDLNPARRVVVSTCSAFFDLDETENIKEFGGRIFYETVAFLADQQNLTLAHLDKPLACTSIHGPISDKHINPSSANAMHEAIVSNMSDRLLSNSGLEVIQLKF